MNRLKKGTAMAATLVGGFEGLRTVAYPDPATMGRHGLSATAIPRV
ncbi:MAG: hypothetical protein ACTHJQ_05530 [Rhizobiaceae bacterium]